MNKLKSLSSLPILLFCLLSTLRVQGQTPNSTDLSDMSLEQCVQYAVANNPELRSTALDQERTAYQIQEIRAQALPQVNGTGQFLHNFALPEQLLPGEVFGQPGETVAVKFGVANTLSGNLELNQLLFSPAYRAGIAAANASSELALMNTLKSTENLVFNIAQLYFQLQINSQQRAIVLANIERLDQLISIAEIQLEEGIIKKIDVDQLVVNRTNLVTELLNVEIGFNRQLNLLKLYMGLSIDTEIGLSDYESMEQSLKLPVRDQLVLTDNIDIRLLDKQAELSQLESASIRAGYSPSLSGFIRYGWQGQTDRLFSSDESYKIQGTTTGVVGLNLSVPIFDGLKRRNQIAQIRVQQEQLALSRQYLNRSISFEFANAVDNLRQNQRVLDAQQDNVNLAEELYHVTRLSYQEGVAPLTELLNAETSLREAQTQYLTSQLQIRLAELDQMRTSGQLAYLIRTAE